MKMRLPSGRIREKFLLVYELEGCQKAVDFLTGYYGVRRMRIILDGRRVGNGNIASYFENKAYFTKRGLTKRTVLHELYYHLAYINDVEIPERIEERAANRFARVFLGQRLGGH
jgi:hypothetical protein